MMQTNDDNDIYFAGVIKWKDDQFLSSYCPFSHSDFRNYVLTCLHCRLPFVVSLSHVFNKLLRNHNEYCCLSRTFVTICFASRLLRTEQLTEGLKLFTHVHKRNCCIAGDLPRFLHNFSPSWGFRVVTLPCSLSEASTTRDRAFTPWPPLAPVSVH